MHPFPSYIRISAMDRISFKYIHLFLKLAQRAENRRKESNQFINMPLPTHFTLNTGTKIPAVGFGTWQAAPHEVERAVETALCEGYRHIDCAAIYRNETEVGQGIRNSGVPREEIFLTSKLWNTKHAPEDVEAAVDKSLKDLGFEYLDLYLMHWHVYVAIFLSCDH